MPTERLHISPTAFRAGSFDAAKRYLRAGSTLSNFPICRSATLSMNLVQVSGIAFEVRFRYSVAGYIQQSSGAGSANANYTLVTT